MFKLTHCVRRGLNQFQSLSYDWIRNRSNYFIAFKPLQNLSLDSKQLKVIAFEGVQIQCFRRRWNRFRSAPIKSIELYAVRITVCFSKPIELSFEAVHIIKWHSKLYKLSHCIRRRWNYILAVEAVHIISFHSRPARRGYRIHRLHLCRIIPPQRGQLFVVVRDPLMSLDRILVVEGLISRFWILLIHITPLWSLLELDWIGGRRVASSLIWNYPTWREENLVTTQMYLKIKYVTKLWIRRWRL